MSQRSKSYKAPLGRPPSEVQRDQIVAIRLTEKELELVRAEAERLALSVSAYVRTTLMERVRGNRK